ncbi:MULTISPECIES: WGR domain-containing protein [Stenotrophomonas]|jgi:predicted DNA-binding WGR domain protein|uniref:WGR domain-containing protein n=1 Tax=Stenotrophomonas maltophilia TaxID=40324 RepID=A0A4S2D8T8_STEMA|nr:MULTISPECIES: WGR domain-containing protein [Stenotrophomonas]MBD3826261.1 WGR domain-containing protein [Stenotrophomonas sp.]QIO89135.1 hypothetical protein G9274_002820 [Stenotrophomonas rhizophila]TGY37261.1 WGR domain-containing protein [Stenotrophomonas maltophilia]
MRVFLHQLARGADPARYLQLTLQPDLFGGWELLHESGSIGGRGQLRRELFLQEDLAQAAFEKARDAHLHRGYTLTRGPGDPPR